MTTARASGRRLIDGRFELVEPLGGGGMGLVWRAWDVALHREVALKEVRAPDAASPGSDPAAARMLRERLLREARALARLQHPNVVTIHHIVDSTELRHPWLVMELVGGGSLDARLQSGPLSAPDVIRVGRGVLAALSAAHAAGILHRDVKPANVLLRLDGTPVLTDFGIAALRESPGLTATGMLIGSPEYMAPERIRGEEGNPASDLWSLGMLLYVAVEGHSPVRRESAIATIAAVLDAPIPPARCGGPLAAALAALLTRDPAARPDAPALDRMLAIAGSARADPASTDPTGASSWPLSQHQRQTVTLHPAASSSPDRSRTKRTAVIAGSAVLLLVGVLSLILTRSAPHASHDAASRGTAPSVSAPAAQGGASPVTALAPPAAASGDLLTPAGVRAAIRGLRTAIGGKEFKTLVVYPTFAAAQAPTRGDRTVYDNYAYRDGTASDTSPGGALSSTDVLFDPTLIRWDRLPALIRAADARLGVAHPSAHHIIVIGDFLGTDPALLVYVDDSYNRTAYLIADARGDIVRTYPYTPSG